MKSNSGKILIRFSNVALLTLLLVSTRAGRGKKQHVTLPAALVYTLSRPAGSRHCTPRGWHLVHCRLRFAYLKHYDHYLLRLRTRERLLAQKVSSCLIFRTW
ncbi:hypothetical protein NPIL_259781 [Nephila pilipes]|uniref:Secreted protein n=1 Tax=Nephila pilipes TaxID=299642 RepID=A0A8X6MMQ6_NEPPI|nr:hypothetical protein NPIL_259781 [Nephila pilipes]